MNKTLNGSNSASCKMAVILSYVEASELIENNQVLFIDFVWYLEKKVSD